LANRFLDPQHWPISLPSAHRELLSSIIAKLSLIRDLLGLAAGGSFVHGPMDQYSDLDLNVVVHPRRATAVMETRRQIAESLGELLVAYTAEHIGLPQMLVCLYANGPIHVAMNFVTPEEFALGPERPVILWDRDGTLEEALCGHQTTSSGIDWQWIEDRFWVWTHCALTKVGRGELFSALEYLSFIREKVLGPIVLEISGGRPYTVRRVEQVAPEYVSALQGTMANYNKKEIMAAIQQEVRLYRLLRRAERRREAAEAAVGAYLAAIQRQTDAEAT
jgi:hypothetical protein